MFAIRNLQTKWTENFCLHQNIGDRNPNYVLTDHPPMTNSTTRYSYKRRKPPAIEILIYIKYCLQSQTDLGSILAVAYFHEYVYERRHHHLLPKKIETCLPFTWCCEENYHNLNLPNLVEKLFKLGMIIGEASENFLDLAYNCPQWVRVCLYSTLSY